MKENEEVTDYVGNELRSDLEPIFPRLKNGKLNFSELSRLTGVHYQRLQDLIDKKSNLTQTSINKLKRWINLCSNFISVKDMF